jgi:hypothetical protein
MAGRILGVWVLVVALGGAGAWAAPSAPPRYSVSFGAEFTLYYPKSPRPTEQARLFVTPTAVRLERPGFVILYAAGPNRTYILSPDQKQYLEVAGPATEIGEYLPVRPSPCAGYARGLACQRVGVERVAGRSAERWRIGSGASAREVWVDRALGLVVRLRSGGTDLRILRSLRMGPQPASLFRIPPGYRKIGP